MTSPRRRRARPGLELLAALPAAYYAAQIALRSAPLGRPEVIAHRGGRAGTPENTLSAVRHAIEVGVDGLEFDIQRTRDGVLVVMHDETVDRTTNGTGRVVDLTLAQLRALDAGRGEKVPTLDEVLDLARSASIRLFPEIKSAHLYPGIEAEVLQALEQAGCLDRSVIQSFEADTLTRLRQLSSQVQLCALHGLWQLGVGAPPGNPQYVGLMAEMAVLNPYMIRQAHDQGRKALVWFGAIDRPAIYRWMAFFGVDGVISDDPSSVRRTLRP
jgi:glycerophosphoryl diester phosphodiesterase